MLTKDLVIEALSHVKDPELNRSLTELKMVRDVQMQKDKVAITIALTVPNCPMKDQIEADVRSAVAALPGVNHVTVDMTSMTDKERAALFGEKKDGTASAYNVVQRVVAIMSGKGGVGKSLVTSLLAVSLAKKGFRTGILDADITGPSIPMLFGLRGMVEPGPVGIRPMVSRSEVKIISMNFLLDNEDRPVIWRGPLIGRAITQLWGDVMWGTLDYLLVDLPPGTSDAALTTMQSLPVKGVLMITTPQGLASMIVRKAVNMAQAVGVHILGVVENMAYFICPETGKSHFIFGPSHSQEVALAAGAPLITQLPIDPEVARMCDAGRVEDVNLPGLSAMVEAFLKVVPLESNDDARD